MGGVDPLRLVQLALRMAQVKVLLSGAPDGKLTALFKKVANVNKSNGPFAVLFCVGSFFQDAGTETRSSSHGLLVPLSIHPSRV
jgi:hypothetical protein